MSKSKHSFVLLFFLNKEKVTVYSTRYKGMNRKRYVSRLGVVTAGRKMLPNSVLVAAFEKAAATGRAVHLETTE